MQAIGGAGSDVSVEVRELDLGSLASVRRFVQQVGSDDVHLLVCNAGIMAPPKRTETADGLEQQFQVL